jgi:hypothetical protein
VGFDSGVGEKTLIAKISVDKTFVLNNLSIISMLVFKKSTAVTLPFEMQNIEIQIITAWK